VNVGDGVRGVGVDSRVDVDVVEGMMVAVGGTEVKVLDGGLVGGVVDEGVGAGAVVQAARSRVKRRKLVLGFICINYNGGKVKLLEFECIILQK
jgi:hypothetical protein